MVIKVFSYLMLLSLVSGLIAGGEPASSSAVNEDYQPTDVPTADLHYRFFRPQGVAVRVHHGKVTEVVAAPNPDLSR